jgi:hypothetical protein
LSHITRNPRDTEEFNAALDIMHNESDRGIAITGTALFEEAFTSAINSILVNKEDQNALRSSEAALSCLDHYLVLPRICESGHFLSRVRARRRDVAMRC